MSGRWRALVLMVLALVAMDAEAGTPTFTPWTRLGPGNLGGRTRALLAVSATRLYAGGSPGGVWRSDDAGASWTNQPGVPTNQRVSALAVEPGDPLTLYAGTGDRYDTTGTITGNGIYRTRDGGVTWTLLDATASPTSSSFGTVTRVAVSPLVPSRVYATTSVGLFQSFDRGNNWFALRGGGFTEVAVRTSEDGLSDTVQAFGENGVLATSQNAGATVNVTTTGLPAGMRRATIKFAPDGTSVALVSTLAGVSGGIYRSVDFGRTYTRLELADGSFQGRANAAILNNARNVLDFSLPTGPDCPVTPDPPTPDSGFFAQALGISPTTRVWVGGVDLWRSNDLSVSYGPASYAGLTPGQPSFAAADHHQIVFSTGYDGAANQTVFFANDTGLFKTDNGEAAVPSVLSNANVICRSSAPLPAVVFGSLNNGYAIAEHTSGAVHPSANVILAGVVDRGLARFAGGGIDAWTQVGSGTGFSATFDLADPNVVYATGLGVAGDFFRSSDGGLSFTQSPTPGFVDAGTFGTRTPIGQDPVAGTLWFGAGRPHRSTDGGATWTPATAFNPLTSAPIAAWAIARTGGGQVVYLGTTDGSVYVSRDALAASPTWTQIDFNTFLPDRPIAALAVDPTDENRLFVAFDATDVIGGLSSGQLWTCADTRAPDFVTSIGPSGAQIPNLALHALLIHPQDRELMFVGNQDGVLMSTDAGARWTSVASGALPGSSVTHLALQGATRLVAFTSGNGVLDTTLTIPLVTVVSPNGGERLLPGSTVPVTWSASPAASGFASLDHFDVSFTTDGVVFTPIASVPGTDRSVDWVIPPGLRSTTARVRVQARSAANALLGEDASDAAAIVNGRPVADAGAPSFVLPSVNATISAVGSSDPDGDALAFTWTQTAPVAPIAPIVPNQPVNTFPMPATRGFQFDFSLLVGDGTETATATTFVRVNQLPIADAGTDRRVIANSTVTLSGTGSSDPDGQALAYTWGQTAGPPAFFTTNTVTTTFVAPATAGQVQDFLLDVSDGLESSQDAVRITVNTTPTAVASAPARVRGGQAFTLDASASSDPDPDALTYLWTQVSGPAVAPFVRTLASPSVSAPPIPGAVVAFSVAVFDTLQTTTANTTITVNRPPVALITGPAGVLLGGTATLTGDTSTDGDGDALTYTWTQTAGPAVAFATTTANTSFTAPNVPGASFTFRLDVNDGLETGSATKTVRINVAPTANAGADLRVAPGAVATLDGLASTDPDADPLSFAWTQTTGVTVTLTGAATPVAQFTAPTARGTALDFRLTVSDGVESATDDVQVRVNQLPVSRPVAPAQVKPGDLLTLSGATSTDPDGDPLTYLWTQTGGPPLSFATGTAITSATVPDARGSVLAFTLRASDGVESSTAAVSTRVNRLPTPRLAVAELVVPPGANGVLDASGSTDPDGDVLSYTWTQVSGPPVTFDTAAAAPSIPLSGLARGDRVELTLTAFDGLESVTQGAVARVNQAPVVAVAGQVLGVPGEVVQVSAAGSSDPDGDALRFRWRQTAGTPVTFDVGRSTLSFTAPAIGNQTLGFSVDVSDGTETATAAVTVILGDRAYAAGVNAAGGAGGCQAGARSGESSPFSLPGMWLMAVLLGRKRRRKSTSGLTTA